MSVSKNFCHIVFLFSLSVAFCHLAEVKIYGVRFNFKKQLGLRAKIENHENNLFTDIHADVITASM